MLSARELRVMLRAVEPLFHITSSAAWQAARSVGEYRADSLATEGFIHLSTEQQWRHTLHRFYRDHAGLVVLVIDPARLGSEVRYERVHGEDFPHLYGPLATAAVVAVRPAPRMLALAGELRARIVAVDDAIEDVIACVVAERGHPASYGVLVPRRGREGTISLAAVIRAAQPELAGLGWMQLHSLPRLSDGTLDEVALLAYVEGLVAAD
jgi:uncharacterized protein (DUF952 family)